MYPSGPTVTVRGATNLGSETMGGGPNARVAARKRATFRDVRPSTNSSLNPVPHCSCLQKGLQPSHDVRFPSSHSSPGSTTPSPQGGSWHVAWQPSPSLTFPSSHSSPGSTTPSPQ